MAKIRVWEAPVHPMEHQGSLHFTVEVEGHTFSYLPAWYNCGETGADFICTCGFHTYHRTGIGCWTQDHNNPMEPELDNVHARLVALAIRYAKEEQIGYPSQWEDFEQLVQRTGFAVVKGD